MSDIKIEGIERFQAKIKKNVSLSDVKKVVRHYGKRMEKYAKMNTKEFKGHYEWRKGEGYVFVEPTGNLKRGIISESKRDGLGKYIVDGGMTAEVYSTAEYAGYVEVGTRYMDAQPYLKPAFKDEAENMKRDLKRLEK